MSRITPPTPVNALTPGYSTVSSPTGFQSGDLVYYRDSSFGNIPGNAVTAAPFDIIATNAPLGGPFGRNAFISVLNESINRGVSGRQRFAAVLTNGNIVVVYAEGRPDNTTQGNPLFRIVDTNFNTVVAETPITTAETVFRSAIGVTALVGGGFAVSYVTGSSTLRVAVYSNTGAVVTAAYTPSGWAASIVQVDVEPLPSGGFVVAANQTASGGGANQYRVATFNAAGTQINANSPVISTFASNDTPQMVVLSDGRFVIATRSASTTGVVTGFNADCTTVGSSQTFSLLDPNSAAGGGYSLCVLSNNEVVLATSISGGTSSARKYFISTNSFGSTENLNLGQTAFYPMVTTLPGDNIAAIMEGPSGTTVLQIIQSNLSTVVSTTTYTGISLDTGSGNRQAICSILTPSRLTYFMSTTNTNTGTGPATPIQYFQFNSAASYAPVYRRAQNVTATTSSSPVSGYARSTSTPNRASFLASTNATLSSSSTTLNGTNFYRAPYIAKTGVTYMDSCMMLDGRMVVAYATGTPAAGFVVINALGNIVADIPISTSGNSVAIKCTALNNGRLALAFSTTAGDQVLFLQVYDSNFNLATSTTLTAALGGANPRDTATLDNGGFGISSVGVDRFVVHFCRGDGINRGQYAVFTDSIVLLETAFTSPDATARGISVAGNIDGSFVTMSFQTTPGNVRWSRYVQVGANAWASVFSVTGGWQAGASRYATTGKMHPSGVAYFIQNAADNGNDTVIPFIGNNSDAIGSQSISAGEPALCTAISVGATGEIVVIKVSNAQGNLMQVYAPGTAIRTGGVIIQNSFTAPTARNFGSGSAGSAVCLECLYDRTYALVYRGTSNEMYISLFTTANVTYSTTLTSGVTASSGGLVPSPANGYYLAGVSTSDCAAGGTGVLQINGAAALNSQYPATTTSQAFDFNTPALDVGVRGTIAGRNVILSGGK